VLIKRLSLIEAKLTQIECKPGLWEMLIPKDSFNSVSECGRNMSTGHPCISQLVVLLEVPKDPYPYLVR
jgi:hypothetical protein